jgi:probable F420-dependent oxidoreductase
MDFGVFLPVSGRAATRQGIVHAAQQAEKLGSTTAWAAGRIIIRWSVKTPYTYNWSGSFFVPPDVPFLEPLTTLAFLAGATERIRLGMSVLVMPYRNPIYWAKIVATLHHLSEGRFILGVGVGWMEEELAALGHGELFASRGRVANEHIEIFRVLMSEPNASQAGEFYEFNDVGFEPKGHGGGGMNVWVGGEAKPSQRRAARYGDAWFPYFVRVTPEDIAERWANVQRTAAEAGREPKSINLNCCLAIEITDREVEQEPDLLRGSPRHVAARLNEFREVGVEHVGLQFLVGRYPERLAQMRRFSDEVLHAELLS